MLVGVKKIPIFSLNIIKFLNYLAFNIGGLLADNDENSSTTGISVD